LLLKKKMIIKNDSKLFVKIDSLKHKEQRKQQKTTKSKANESKLSHNLKL